MHRTARFTAGVAVVATAALVTILLLGWFLFADTPFGSLFFFLSWVIGATTFLSILFLPWYPVAEVRSPPDPVLAHLALQLRVARHHVAQDPRRPVLTVKVDSVTAVKIRVRPTADGSRVSFQPYATPAGLFVMLILLLTTEAALLALPVTAYLFFRSYRFVAREVRRLLSEGQPLPALPAPDDVGVLLITGLAEGHRLASEAHDMEKSAYHDNLLLAMVLAIAVWALVFIGIFAMSTDPDFGSRVNRALGLSVVSAVALGVGARVIAYVRFRPRILRYRFWADRLWDAWTREVTPSLWGTPGPSAFELLVESFQELPRWLEVRRRSWLSRDPALGFLVIAIVIWAFELLGGGVSLLISGNWLWSILAFAVGIALSVGLYLLYGWIKRRADEEETRDYSDWNRRLETVRSRMDRFLQDL